LSERSSRKTAVSRQKAGRLLQGFRIQHLRTKTLLATGNRQLATGN